MSSTYPAEGAPRRRMGLIPLALVLSVGCVVQTEVPDRPTGPTPAPASAPAPDEGREQQMARDVFDRVNDERTARGLDPVAWDEQLAAIARSWSADMAGRGTLGHQDVRELLQREDLSYLSAIGENVFQATGPVPAGSIHVGWMRSDSHRVNVVNPGWDRLGIGVHCAQGGTVWATQEYGRTRDAERPALEEETPSQEPIARPADEGPSCA
jgi:uncharacterized protein YkwD